MKDQAATEKPGEENRGLLAVGSELVRVTAIKCDNCNCSEPFREDNERYKKILEVGFGLNVVASHCSKSGCYCHTGLGPPRKLKLRFVDFGEVPYE